MKHLKLQPLGEIEDIASPDVNTCMDLNAPAITVFTDFSVYHPFDLHYGTGAREAIQLMQLAHVRLKFVVDSAGHFLGIVTNRDLNNQEIIKKIAEGYEDKELTVATFMKPKSQLTAINFEDLEHANIGDVLAVMKESSCRHCLVVNQPKNHIQGIISSSDIARKLRVPQELIGTPDFIDVFKVIRPDYLDKKREQVSRTLS